MDTEVNEQIAQLKSQLLKNQQEILDLDKNIGKIKVLQLKALTILKSLEKKAENDKSDLENIGEKLKNYMCMKAKTNSEKELEDPQTIEKLKKQLNELKQKLLETKAKKKDLASKIYKVKLEIAEQEKINAAEVLELQKKLDVLRQEENYLLSILNSKKN